MQSVLLDGFVRAANTAVEMAAALLAATLTPRPRAAVKISGA
jgi:hypothetical protein